MDFPVTLNSKSKWVYGRDELRQNLILILKNHVGTFIQSNDIGAYYDVHCEDEELIEENVRQTLEEIPYIKINNIEVILPVVNIQITYNGDVINFQYPLDV